MKPHGLHPRGETILAFLDGELAPAFADEVRDHCAACAECRQVSQELSSVREILVAHPGSAPLRPVWPAVQGRLERPASPFFRPAFGIATTAAALVGILLGVFVGSIGNRHPRHEGAYLWSVVPSSIAQDGGGTLPDIYAITTSASGEGR